MKNRDSLDYVGLSMTPTFRQGDGLDVVPYKGKPVKPGDVVVFKHPKRESNVVHRVISITEGGMIQTQGDNNSLADPWVVKKEDLIGKVRYRLNGNKKKSVLNGTAGYMYFLFIQVTKAWFGIIWKIIRPVYLRIKYSDLKRRIVLSNLKPRLINYNRRRGEELQLIVKGHCIARKRAGSEGWFVQPFMRVILDEKTLEELLRSFKRCT